MKVTVQRIVVLLLYAISTQAKFHVATRSQQLQNLIDEYSYSVVCFAPATVDKNQGVDSDQRKKIKKAFDRLKFLVRSASEIGNYKKYLSKDVGFVVADSSSKHIQEVAHEYHVGKDPICIPFQAGAAGSGVIKNPTSSKQLLSSLEHLGGSDLKQILNQRQQDARLDKEERIAAYYAYANTYPYWGWGGWYGYGFYPYWRRPYWTGWYV